MRRYRLACEALGATRWRWQVTAGLGLLSTTAPRRKVRLYCFRTPARASVFRGWSSLPPSTIELWVARLPGREQRISGNGRQPRFLVSAACESSAPT
jgi:hypothetical protein